MMLLAIADRGAGGEITFYVKVNHFAYNIDERQFMGSKV